MIVNGMPCLWFVLTALSLIYTTFDLIFVTPKAGMMKIGFWLVTLYAGPIDPAISIIG